MPSFDLSPMSLLAGLIFGAIGLWMFKQGKDNTNFAVVFIGLGLMLYSWFTPNAWWDWGVGIALCVLARRLW